MAIYFTTNSDGNDTEGIGAMAQYQIICYTLSKLYDTNFYFTGFKNLTHHQYFNITKEQWVSDIDTFFNFKKSNVLHLPVVKFSDINEPLHEFLIKNDNLIVFGFEPSTECHNSFTYENNSMRKKFPECVFIEPDRINKTFFPIKCALSNGEARYQKFYVTENDLGCSSLYEPLHFPVLETEDVAVITLKHFFDLFPWDKISYIDQLKIDAQGSDFSIIEGAGDYLSKIVYITLENSAGNHYKKNEDYHKFRDYLSKYEFFLLEESGVNSTYLNTVLVDKLENVNFFIENK